MKIQICSDLHLEYAVNQHWIKENPLRPVGDVLLIAGDVYHLDKRYELLDFIQVVAEQFEEVYLIPGNHEYYNGYDLATALSETHLKIKENVHLVNNKAIQIGGVNFVFTTLWTSVEREIEMIVSRMPDFHQIPFNGGLLSVDNYNRVHNYCFDFLKTSLRSDMKNVVVSHHLPSRFCNAAEFKDSPMNEAFCVDKTEFIKEANIDYWVYGHSHRNLQDFEIGGTQLLTNQLGYLDWGEHHTFQLDKFFEV